MVSKKILEQDPFAEREASQYDNPVPSREFILEFLRNTKRPVNYDFIANAFEIGDNPAEVDALMHRLKAMLRDAQLMLDRRRRFCVVDKLDMVAGRIRAHPDGHGFVVPDNAGDNIFLSYKQMRQVMNGDRVLVQPMKQRRRGERVEGIICEVLERNTQQVVGQFHEENGEAFVQPENKYMPENIPVPSDATGGAVNGQMVMVDIIQQPTKRHAAVGAVREILGEHMAPGMEIDVALRSYDLPYIWPDDVAAQAAGFDNHVVTKADCEGRADLRDLPLMTIDGSDARDFDDAVHCKPCDDGGWVLYVAIADVSHYVEKGSPLDREAINRGNSVYFPERVIPMLPEVLSNGLCSLNPNVDRLCMVCEMKVSDKGEVSRFRFYPAVMHSHARLTYTQVASMVKYNKPVRGMKNGDKLLPHLQNLYAMYQVLIAARKTRGAIDFDTVDTRIIFDKNKKIAKIIPTERNEAHRIIEECMLAANVCAANFLLKAKMPGIYRNHAIPSEEKLADLRAFLGEQGLQLTGGKEPHAKDYGRLLDSIREREDFELIQTVLLRSLMQAVYEPDNIGHFGLAYKAYTHFTSPIRRYPDLLVHRAIRHLAARGKAADYHYTEKDMQHFGEHCSMTERRADDATRDVVDWLKCEFMLDKVGQQFSATIATVTGFGLFVRLNDIYVEGLVHITALETDYYNFDAAKHRLVGERTHKIYKLGDPIDVVLVRVDLDGRKIDFDLPGVMD